MKFRKLNENEIECRVSTINAKGLSLLLYKDARCDMRILDEEIGAEFWTRDHKEIKGNVYCGVGIYMQIDDPIIEKVDNTKIVIERAVKEWVFKWDAGAESYTEKVKGEASDSFKRACFNWGIGRELYTAPFIWIKPNSEKEITFTEYQGKKKYSTYTKFKVSKIEYKNDAISHLVISDSNGAVRYTFGLSNKKADKKVISQLIDLNISYKDLEKWANYYAIAYGETDSIADICGKFSQEQAEFIIDRFKNKGGK